MQKDIDPDVMETMNQMQLAAIYNKITGANLSHWDLAEVGILEEARILAAAELWNLLNG